MRKCRVKPVFRLSFCPTGPGGGVDPSCSPNNKESGDPRERAFRQSKREAEAASIAAHAEKNTMKAAALHEAARRLHAQAARQTSLPKGAADMSHHFKMAHEHQLAARAITDKLLGVNRTKMEEKRAKKIEEQRVKDKQHSALSRAQALTKKTKPGGTMLFIGQPEQDIRILTQRATAHEAAAKAYKEYCDIAPKHRVAYTESMISMHEQSAQENLEKAKNIKQRYNIL